MSGVKILYIVDSYTNPYAGTESQLYKLIAHLDRTRFDPHLLVFNSSAYINENGFPCETTFLGKSRLSSLSTWFALFQCLKEKKRAGFRLAHIFFNDPSIIAPPLLKVLGFKTLISRRDMGYWYTSAYLFILRFNARIIDGAIVNSQAVKDITCKQEHIRAEDVHVVYNGYDALEVSQSCAKALYAIDQAQELLLEQENNGNSSDAPVFTIGIVANIRPIKRMQDAVMATAALHNRGYAVRLVIVGGGDQDDLRALAAQQNIAGRVLFMGPQSDTSSYIQNFDLCLLCSESEGFSNAIIEYMQHGKPVVCSRVGGNPEIIDDGESGCLYPAGDVDALASLVEVFLKDGSRAEIMGQSAHRKVSGRFALSQMLERTYEIYSKLAG